MILNATVDRHPPAPASSPSSPPGTARPLASDLNYAAGETRPNLVVVKVGTGGKVSLFTSAGDPRGLRRGRLGQLTDRPTDRRGWLPS